MLECVSYHVANSASGWLPIVLFVFAVRRPVQNVALDAYKLCARLLKPRSISTNTALERF